MCDMDLLAAARCWRDAGPGSTRQARASAWTIAFSPPTHDPHDEHRASVAHVRTGLQIGRMEAAILEADWPATQAESVLKGIHRA